MTKMELNQKWDSALEIMKEELTDLVYKTWILPLKPSRFRKKDSTVFVSTDNEQAVSIINNRYISSINSAMRSVCERDIKVVIAVPPKKENDEDYVNPFTDELFLNPKYTFDNFVVGKNNNFARAVCSAVADSFSQNYNPLFLYGGSGLGKTHLMHAIGQHVMRKNPKRKVLYVSSEMFTNELIEAIQRHQGEAFRNKYRKIDILLLDDVQFIENKASTEEEVFHTFETLYAAGKQIVFSSDRPPRELEGINERLRSRFSCGMVADIQPPDYETRMAILMKKAEIEEILVTGELEKVLQIIAENIHTNIREMEGAFTRIVAHSNLMNQKITVDFAKNVLSDIFNFQKKEITPASIKKAVSEFFGVKISDLESKKRSKNIAYPRQVAIYLIREKTNLSLPNIGKEFGGRDHATIKYSCDKISEEIETNSQLRYTLQKLETALEGE